MALFRGPIYLTDSVVQEICQRAKLGYEKKMKAETFGFLFGTIDKNKRLVVKKAVYYRGGKKSRSGVIFKHWSQVWHALNRRTELANRYRLRFLGNFHSHVEIAGDVFRGLSQDDKDSFLYDPSAIIEVVVSVWASERNQVLPIRRGLAGYDPQTGYQYRIKAYTKKRNRVYQVTIKYERPKEVIISI
ncbi:MAG: hypothetical protein ABIK93_00810 [candidate division WOR-3 bacterium]